MSEHGRPTPIGEAIAGFLQRHGLARRIAQASIIAEWDQLVGPQIAAVTEAESITADGVLWVRVATSAWAQELSMMTPGILARVNQGRTGRVKSVRWVASPLRRSSEHSRTVSEE